jgi:hypothetical protein
MKFKLSHSLRTAGRIGVAIAAMLLVSAVARSQSPRVLYTFDGAASTEDWTKGFGTNTVTFSNSIPGELTIAETGAAGSGVAISDGFNRIVEASTVSGGLDLTGLDYLEFDLGHNGIGPVNVQFYAQAGASPNTYKALGPGPDFAVLPGMNTYQVALPALTYAEQVYIRTVGFSIRDHIAEGNLTWTLGEVRSGGTPLIQRELVNHNIGSSENGIQGAIANFDLAAIQGNNGGQNQTGLVHNTTGPGSLQWVDLGGSNGAAVTWGNGTFWNGNSFNERMTDLSNYEKVTFRVKATDPLGQGGSVNFQPFFQFVAAPTFQSPGLTSLPIDGQWHVLTYPLSGITGLDLTSWTGINLGAHANTFTFDVDYIRFSVPEPSSCALVGLAMAGLFVRRNGLKPA